MKRIMGLDYGAKTVGVALSDPCHIIASPFEVIRRERENALRPVIRRILTIVREQDVGLIVLGYPLRMDDTRGERAAAAEDFGRLLERRLQEEFSEVRVVLHDERLSTRAADEVLVESGRPLSERKENVDKIAAAIILRDYMDHCGT